jgi:hypothetical protein
MMMFLAALLAAEAAQAAVPPTASVAKPVTTSTQRPSRAQVAAAVKAEWAQHDQGGKGRLTPLEFGTWVMKSHGATVANGPRSKGIKPVSAMNAASTAFARADANHDGGVTPDEMTDFLLLPPAPTALQREQAAAQGKAATMRAAKSATSAASAKAGSGG